MTFIESNLLADEKIIFRTKKHLIVFFVPIVFLLCAFFFCLDIGPVNTINNVINGFTMSIPFLREIHRMPAMFFLLLAVYASFRPMLLYNTSEYVVTNKRVIMRQGFFERSLTDTRLTTISHVTMDQGPLGQMLNFGNIAINGFGGKSDYFTQIAYPNDFQKSVNAQLAGPPV
jgi:membrane protein YdbS with pleckstrin-like domain